MFSNRLAFAALAVACIAAAAGGGYLASRQNAVPAPVAATSAPVAVPAATPDARPVQETEALVGDATKSHAAADDDVAVVTKSATTAKRVEAAAPPAGRDAKATPKLSARQTPAAGARAAGQSPATPTLTSSWPSGATPPPSAPGAPADATASRTPDAPEPRTPEPPQKTFEELVVSADSVIGLQTENRISSETARVEDQVEARVSRDVKVGDHVAIPAGSRALGNVTLVERGGKFKDRARLGVRFHTLVLADGTRLPISTETIYRDGDPPSNASASKIGGAAVGGAILGAILGGAKGAAIGATAGAGGGAAAVAAGDRSAVVLQPGTPMTVRILSPITVTTEKN